MSANLLVTLSITAAEFHVRSFSYFALAYSSNSMSLEIAVAPDLTSASYLACTSSVSAAFGFFSGFVISFCKGKSGISLMSMSLSFFSAAEVFDFLISLGLESSN